MRAIYIIVEGQTEEEFVKNSLYTYLTSRGVLDVRAIKLRTSSEQRGGDINYSRFKFNIVNLLKKQNDIVVTSLIDFFKIRNDFPSYESSRSLINPVDKVILIENAIRDEINNKRFIPYIQLHEFEGLLFTKMDGFNLIPEVNNDSIKKQELNEIIENNPNPELINEGDTTAPSKRLVRIIPKYRKSLYGPIIALENGIESIIKKCPRFRNWIETIIKKVT